MTTLTDSQIEARRARIRDLIASAGSTFIGVEFTKKDGSLRVMNIQTHAGRALLAGESASESAQQAVVTRKVNNPNLLNAYDVAAKAWRSINLDTLQKIVIRGTEFNVSVPA